MESKWTMRRVIIILIFSLQLLSGIAQEQQPGSAKGQPFFQVLYHTGVHWNSTEYLGELMEDGFHGMEARIGFRSYGRRLWQQNHHYPKYGVGIHYADQIREKSDTTMGNPFSMFAFYNAPLARVGRFTLNTNISMGLGYISHIYDFETNPYNDVVASHINYYFDFNLNVGAELGERIDLTAGYGVTHYSNGNIHEPQKGLNNWGWNLGMSYLFDGREKPFVREEFIHTKLKEYESFEELQLMAAVGIKEWQKDGTPDGAHYFASSFIADYALHYSPKSAVTFGLDLLYDGSLEMSMKILPEDVTTWQKMSLGSHIGYQFKMDRVILLVNLGSYFIQHSYIRGYLFSRLGGRIRLTDHLGIHVTIKTKQGVRSDWIEWGLAYSLKTR
ncbi:MAG: acyloxyacyl hydrolase [Bacteroidota bacterium]